MSHHTGSVPGPGRDPEWQDRAACQAPGIDKEMFFPERSQLTAIRDSKTICWTCPVIQNCLEHAFRNHEDRGTWGGLTEWERRARHGRKPKNAGRSGGVNAPGRRSRNAA
ncbi:WhiB family transcriptional regulator [Streptomyces aureus]|uniref:WhiB family transcriptional regulator n=1 Tax=Streptomyces aureus TaxID=193461 RepID=UPI0007C4E30B|nr:WhiB family transcriptional regulator [Streptomyces aureus]